jgi:hypothetical protein
MVAVPGSSERIAEALFEGALSCPALPELPASPGLVAADCASLQLAAHERVREAARTRGRVAIASVQPVDILGGRVLLPKL